MYKGTPGFTVDYEPVRPRIKHCNHCGLKLETAFHFCPQCGQEVKKTSIKDLQCPNCRKKIERTYHYCPYCQTRVPTSLRTFRQCQCLAILEKGEKFCSVCGRAIRAIDKPLG